MEYNLKQSLKSIVQPGESAAIDRLKLNIAAAALSTCWGQTGLLMLKIKPKHSRRKMQGSQH